MQKYSFSFIIPYYNSSQFIEKNIASLALQTYDKNLIQIILIDDGSNEDSLSVINKLEKKYNIKIDYYKKENGNWGSVINYVLKNKLVKNDYVMVLDSDDCLKKTCLEYVNQNIEDVDVYAITFKRWDGNEREWKKIYPYWTLSSNVKKNKKRTPFCAPLSFFYKSDLFYKIKPLKEKVFYQDSVLLAQILNMTNKIKYTKKTLSLYYYRRENSSTSQKWNKERFLQEFQACKDLIELNWTDVVVYRLAVKEFRKCCNKYKMKFHAKKNFRFSFFPFYIRFLYWIFYLFTIKKYFIFDL